MTYQERISHLLCTYEDQFPVLGLVPNLNRIISHRCSLHKRELSEVQTMRELYHISLKRGQKKDCSLFFSQSFPFFKRQNMFSKLLLYNETVLKLKVSWSVCFPGEAFKIQCFSIVVTSTINYRQSWKSSNARYNRDTYYCSALAGHHLDQLW